MRQAGCWICIMVLFHEIEENLQYRFFWDFIGVVQPLELIQNAKYDDHYAMIKPTTTNLQIHMESARWDCTSIWLWCLTAYIISQLHHTSIIRSKHRGITNEYPCSFFARFLVLEIWAAATSMALRRPLSFAKVNARISRNAFQIA